MLGTVAAGCCFYWRIYFWPERFGYAGSPYGLFLLGGSHLFDLLYPLAFRYVEKEQQEKDGGRLQTVEDDGIAKKRS